MGKSKKQSDRMPSDIEKGLELVKNHPLFGNLYGKLIYKNRSQMGRQAAAFVCRNGDICINQDFSMNPKQWAYVIAHCYLHLAFGHFDSEKIPGYETEDLQGNSIRRNKFDAFLWNEACDIYIHRFLEDIKFGEPLYNGMDQIPGGLSDEQNIYEYLLIINASKNEQLFGTASSNQLDMHGLECPIVYKKQEKNKYMDRFANTLRFSVNKAVAIAGNDRGRLFCTSIVQMAANWFTDRYPLLGALASAFEIIDDYKICQKLQIKIAAINVSERRIYANPSCGYTREEWKFVLAHEYLHAGLEHERRSQGREPYLWNIACDFVINGWLQEMHIGQMPSDGLMYDPELKGYSAEAVYDLLVRDIRRYKKLQTFRGYDSGDILSGKENSTFKQIHDYTTLDDFCRNALQQGLEYEQAYGRGFIPRGLIEEIKALAMPAIPWNVELARWFDQFIEPLEKHRSYARPSRRQGATPDIPRPSYVRNEVKEKSRTFGVVIDTSGSMSVKRLGMALGAVASYAVSRDVPYVRVVFCDAAAYDAGYMAPEDIAGRVQVKGRGGTVLQPGVDLLEQAKDFPQDGPILIITDGKIESTLRVRREHAFLISGGKCLPFHHKGKVFKM